MPPVEAVLMVSFTLIMASLLSAVGDRKDDSAQWRRLFQLRWSWLLAWTSLMLLLGCAAGRMM